jgi:hypothetical protein
VVDEPPVDANPKTFQRCARRPIGTFMAKGACAPESSLNIESRPASETGGRPWVFASRGSAPAVLGERWMKGGARGSGIPAMAPKARAASATVAVMGPLWAAAMRQNRCVRNGNMRTDAPREGHGAALRDATERGLEAHHACEARRMQPIPKLTATDCA